MAGIRLTQHGGAGVLNADGDPHPAPVTVEVGLLCQLSVVGVSSATWRWVLSRPEESSAILSSVTSSGPSLLVDLDGEAYSISAFDINENEYILDIVSATSGSGGGEGGGTIVTTIETYADVRAATYGSSTPQAVVLVKCRAVTDDGGGGMFAYDSLDTTTPDDDGAVLVDGEGHRFKRISDDSISATWYGVTADGKKVTDGVVTAASPTFTSATAAFTANDVGKKFLARIPNSPLTGTVSGTTGFSTLTGSGTDFTTIDRTLVDGIPRSGGAAYVDGQFLVVYSIIDADTVALREPLTSDVAAGSTLYFETQVEGTIAAYISPTQVTLSEAAAISLTGVHFTWGSDDSDAFDAAVSAAISLKKPLVMPTDGGICVTANFRYLDVDGLTITGCGKTWTLVDMRKASYDEDYLSSEAYGVLIFKNGTQIRIEDFAYDANIPVLGITHSHGGVLNAAGNRGGLFFDACSYCHIERLRMGIFGGYGARDEYVATPGANSYITVNDYECFTNGPGMNLSSDPGVSPGFSLTNGRGKYNGGLALAADTFEVSGFDYDGDGFLSGGDPIILIPYGAMKVRGLTIRNVDQHTTTSGCVDVLGTVNTVNGLLDIDGITVEGGRHIWISPGIGAALFFNNYRGVATVKNLQVRDCPSETADGAQIVVDGADTGTIYIDQCRLLGGTNVTQGVRVTATVPAGKVHIGDGMKYGADVTAALVLSDTQVDPTMLIKSVSAGGTITLTDAESSHERIKLNGAPGAGLSLVVAPGPYTGWVKTFWSACGQTVTVKASGGDAGVDVTDGATVQLLSDGTNVRVFDQTYHGTLTPEAAVTAPVGAVFRRLDGASSAALYAKVSGSGNTGWENVYTNAYEQQLTRIVRSFPIFATPASWSVNAAGRVTCTVTTGDTAIYCLDLPNGATIDTITMTVIGGGNAALPGNMPRFRVHRHVISIDSSLSTSDAIDGSANVGAYNAVHEITMSGIALSVTNDMRWHIEFDSESGANATAGFTIVGVKVTMTTLLSNLDRGRA